MGQCFRACSDVLEAVLAHQGLVLPQGSLAEGQVALGPQPSTQTVRWTFCCEAMLNGCYLLDRDKMLDDHIDKFELTNKRAVFFFQLLSFLGHKLLDVVVLFIGNF